MEAGSCVMWRKELPEFQPAGCRLPSVLQMSGDLAGTDVLNSVQMWVEGCTCHILVSEVQVQRVWRDTHDLWISELSW